MTPPLADMGIPMIFFQWPLMVVALIPVIVVEALLIRRWVPLSHRDAFVGITKANALSTVVGVPGAWLAMLIVEFAIGTPLFNAADRYHWNTTSPLFETLAIFIGAAWIGLAEGRSATLGIAAASAVLLIPTFFLSVWIERGTCLKAWPTADAASVRRGVFLANLASYGVLLLMICVLMAYGAMGG